MKATNELQRLHCDDDDIGKYLAVLGEIGDDLLLQAVKKVDPSQPEKSWNERLKERRIGSQRAIAILASAGSQLDGPVGDFCRTMLQRIPQRVRDQVR